MQIKSIISTSVILFTLPFFTTQLNENYLYDNQEYAENTPISIDKDITLSFVGDCMVSTYKGKETNGSFNWYAKNYDSDYFFRNVSEIFKNDDLTIANCETVLSDQNLSIRDKGHAVQYWYKGPSSNAKIFTSAYIDVVSTANNHFRDYGTEGQKDTLNALHNENLNVLMNYEPNYFEIKGTTIGILGCGIWSPGCEKEIIEIINEMELNSDIQIIYPHGGEERLHSPERWRQDLFHELIDAGADMVIAHHAHVLQPMEIYHNKPIVYGLGNFCYGGSAHPENRTVIYQCKISLDENDQFCYENTIIPCYVYTGNSNNWQPDIITDKDEMQKVIDFMNNERNLPY